MTTTWNPSDKSANTTLSGGNLVATFGGSSPGVRSIDRVYSGQYYWEFTFTTTTNTLVGICLAGTVFSTLSGGAASVTSTIVLNGGAIWNNGVSSGNVGGTISNGSVLCVALDMGAGLVWFRNGAAGNWNNNVANNPATGVGGLNIAGYAPPGGPFDVYAVAQGGGGGGVITANFGASGFAGAVPGSFTSGFPSGTTAINAEVLTQAAAEQWSAGTPDARLTQAAIEQWAVVSLGNPQLVLTQAALEQWASVAQAIVTQQALAMILA
jgi:hypothetical protein